MFYCENPDQELTVKDKGIRYTLYTGEIVTIPEFYARAKQGDDTGTIVGAVNRNHGGRAVVRMHESGDLITVSPDSLLMVA